MTQRKAVGDWQLLRIDQHLLVDLPVANKEFLFSKLVQFRGREHHVIDIETEVSHRRKGYAEAVARTFVADPIGIVCLRTQLRRDWPRSLASLKVTGILCTAFRCIRKGALTRAADDAASRPCIAARFGDVQWLELIDSTGKSWRA